MAENFRLDPDGLARGTRDARGAGQRLGDAFKRLTEVTDAHDGCWGDDDIGKAFAKNYVGPSADNRKYSQDSVQAFGKYADDGDQASTAFQGVDQQNAQAMDQQNQ